MIHLPLTINQANTLWWLLTGEIDRDGISEEHRRTFKQVREKLEIATDQVMKGTTK